MRPPVIVDIDMTLTSEWYVNDNVKSLRDFPPMVSLIKDLQSAGVPIVISTARPEKLREDTLSWLWKIGIFPEKVYMRSDLDTRPDHFAKQDQAKQILIDFGTAAMWYDDNEDNCRVAESFGISSSLIRQNRDSIHTEILATKVKLLRDYQNSKERDKRRSALSSMSSFRSSLSSLTTQEQEDVATLMVEQLKTISEPVK
jgi:FMN phosphatase YigB (HAD superfamily)